LWKGTGKDGDDGEILSTERYVTSDVDRTAEMLCLCLNEMFEQGLRLIGRFLDDVIEKPRSETCYDLLMCDFQLTAYQQYRCA
jgi:hypothetical protein